MAGPQFFDEDSGTAVHGPAPASITTPTGTYSQAQVQSIIDALNVVIAALKSANILAGD